MARKLWTTTFLILGACGGTAGAVVGELPGAGLQLPETTVDFRSTTTGSPTEFEPPPKVTAADDPEKAFAGLMQARIECGRQPYSCDVATFTEVNSPIYNDLTELVTSRRSARITATGGGQIRYRIDKTEPVSSSRALVHACITDDVVLVDGDIIFDDSTMSSLVTFTLTKVEGRWLWSEANPTRWTTEEDLCGFDA